MLDGASAWVYYMRMKAREQALNLVRGLEKSLRKLVADAAAEGDYEAVLLLTSLAKGAAELSADAEDNPSTAGDMAGRASGRATRQTSAPAPRGGTKQAAVPVRLKGRRKSKKKRKRRSEFPKFRRQGSILVKIGYSKRSGMYTHRAPKEILQVATKAMAQAGDGGKLFTVDDIMAVIEGNSGPEVLGYQVYLCLAWVKHEGLVEPKGRQGYRVPAGTSLPKAVEERWNILPEE